MTVNKTTSDCTIYAFIGTAILAISLVVAMHVGNDFQQSLFVESITFAGSNILLWAIFLSIVNCAYELLTVGNNSKTKKVVIEVESATEQEQPMQTLQQTKSVKYSHEDYVKCVEAQAKKQQRSNARMTKAILDYSLRTMAQFLYEEDVNALVEEIKKWLKNSNYVPRSIDHFKVSIENIPLRHFVWNIAERIGKTEYDTKARIRFITALFPKHFATLDYSTMKNLKAPCAKDLIPIDEPEYGKYIFHDNMLDESEENPE